MVSSIARSIPVPPPRPTAPDYHHYVTSLLHRRWMRVCALVFGVCFVESWLVTTKRGRIFWSLLSAAPVKAVVLWLAMLPVLVMRVQRVHLGSSLQSSAARDIQHYIGSFKTYVTGLSYMFSALIFVMLYMHTSDDSDQLGIVIESKYGHERSRLNERHLYLLFLAIWTGLVHTVVHLSLDRDRVDLPGVTLEPKKGKEELALEAAKKKIQLQEICMREGHLILKRAARQTIITTLTAMFCWLGIRGKMWRWFSQVTRVHKRIIVTHDPYSWPVGFSFFLRTFWISFLIFTLWEFSQSAFKLYFSMEPLKDSKILSDLSVDPNGTLVTGFKQARKPFTQACAFWELVYIAFNKPERRKTIYTDIDRPVRIFEEIMRECLAVLNQVNGSIQQKDQPPAPPPRSSPISLYELASPAKRPPMSPIKDGFDIYLTPSKKIPDLIRGWQTKDGMVLGEKVSAKLAPHTPDIKVAKEKVETGVDSVRRRFLESTAGKPFRQTVERKTLRLIPNVRLQIDAVAALSKLTICALNEDEFGRVAPNFGNILEQFFNTMDTLESYIEAPGIHWSDTDSTDNEVIKAKLKEPKELLDVLRVAVRDMVVAYKPYMNDLNLSVKVGKRTRQVLEKL